MACRMRVLRGRATTLFLNRVERLCDKVAHSCEKIARENRRRDNGLMVMMGLSKARLTPAITTTTTTAAAADDGGGGGGYGFIDVFVSCLGAPPRNDVLRVRQVAVVVNIIVVHHRVHDLCSANNNTTAS